MAQQRTVKVAIIGSGLAGLSAAHTLTEHNIRGTCTTYEVHLFEKTNSLGMDASSVGVGELRIDVPMRSFQGGYYTQLIKLYKSLGVQFKPANFTYSFSLLSRKLKSRTVLIYNGSSALRGVSLPYKDSPRARLSTLALFCLSTVHLLLCYVRLLILSCPLFREQHLDQEGVNTQSFASWEAQTMPRSILSRWVGLDTAWPRFTRMVLLPLFSGVCTANEEDVLAHPMEEFLDYIYQTVFAHHYVVTNGIKDVVSRLVVGMPASHIHVGAGVNLLQPAPNGRVHLHTDDGQIHRNFDHVVFATQANRAVPILETYLNALNSGTEHAPKGQSAVALDLLSCLAKFQYRRTIVVNHTDDRLMPENRSDWRDLNLFSPAASVEKFEGEWDEAEKFDASELLPDQKLEQDCTMPATYTAATHLIRANSSQLEQTYQTTNPTVAPIQDKVISVARLERAVLCAEAKRALRRLYVAPSKRNPSSLGSLQGCGRLDLDCRPGIWVCGSYAAPGIPLLEGCVVSAQAVVIHGIIKCEDL